MISVDYPATDLHPVADRHSVYGRQPNTGNCQKDTIFNRQVLVLTDNIALDQAADAGVKMNGLFGRMLYQCTGDILNHCLAAVMIFAEMREQSAKLIFWQRTQAYKRKEILFFIGIMKNQVVGQKRSYRISIGPTRRSFLCKMLQHCKCNSLAKMIREHILKRFIQQSVWNLLNERHEPFAPVARQGLLVAR